MRNCEIAGWGSWLPDAVEISGETRYRIGDDVSQLDMLAAACERALEHAGIGVGDIDLVLGASAAGLQPIPCTAALVWERLSNRGRTPVHAAALGPVLDRLKIPRDRRVDEVALYGNMVSASVPLMLALALEARRVGRGDTVVLCGTAAGLTANALALRL